MCLKLLDGYFAGPARSFDVVETHNLQDMLGVFSGRIEGAELDCKVARADTVVAVAVGIHRTGGNHQSERKEDRSQFHLSQFTSIPLLRDNMLRFDLLDLRT